MNPQQPILNDVLRWPTARAREWVESTLQRLATDHRAYALVAIGSAVRPGVDSHDLDLVCFTQRGKRLYDPPPMEIDALLFDAHEADRLVAAGHDVLTWALTYGVLLWDRDGYWTRLAARWPRVPMPSAGMAVERASTAMRRLRDLLDIGDYAAAAEQCKLCLTHLARAKLLEIDVHPASRPELPAQLRDAGFTRLAILLEKSLRPEPDMRLLSKTVSHELRRIAA